MKVRALIVLIKPISVNQMVIQEALGGGLEMSVNIFQNMCVHWRLVWIKCCTKQMHTCHLGKC